MQSLTRIVAVCALTFGLAACSGSGSSNNGLPTGFPSGGGIGFGAQCNVGTQVQIARPFNGQTGVNSNLGSIEIVANGNASNLDQTFGQWNLVITPNPSSLGQPFYSGNLTRTSDRSGPQPYPSDYYYVGSLASLPSGYNWNVGLQDNDGSGCQPVYVGSFST